MISRLPYLDLKQSRPDRLLQHFFDHFQVVVSEMRCHVCGQAAIRTVSLAREGTRWRLGVCKEH